MITVSNLAKRFAGQTLFEGVSLQLNEGDRYGVVGANGSGKSTFLKVLTGEEGASEGEVAIPKRARIGVLRQDHFEYETERILDIVMMGHEELWTAMQEKETVLARAEEHFDGDRYAALEETIVRLDGYALEARAGEILEGLGIATEVHEQPLSTLSGGFKLRVLLAQVLAASPDVLLLDEPTNHLDIVSIRWLETFLESFAGCSVIVSHDHRFLDNVSTHIVDVDYEDVVVYAGNYQRFVHAKGEERARREREIEKRQAEIAEHQAFVDRFRAKATKARQAQSKLKKIDKIEIEELPESSRRYPRFRFGQRRPSGRQVLEVEGVSKAYAGRPVLDDVSLVVGRGERVAIIGPNGIGKSTLLKIAVGEVEPDAGVAEWGYETYPGYFAQDHRAQLGNPGQTVESWLWEHCAGQTRGFVRNQLGAVLFTGDEVEKKVGSLSGGEAARLLFAGHSVDEPNVLVLDEPTNHLDLEAIEALVEGLRAYDGTLIFVSHDRWFVGELATRVIEISPAGINDVQGSYEDYLAKCGDDHLDADVALRRAREGKRGKKGGRERTKGPSKARKREVEARLAKVTAEIEAAEGRIAEIDARFGDTRFYETTPRDEIQALDGEREVLRGRVEELMGEWERLETEVS